MQEAIKTAGGKHVRLETFLGSSGSGVKRRDIFKHFNKWDEALRAAGFDYEPYNRRIEDQAMFSDWAAVARKLGCIPSKTQYEKHGRYSSSVILRRAGKWGLIPQAFRTFAGGRPKWKKILAMIADPPVPVRMERRKRAFPAPRRYARKFPALPNGRPLCGEALRIGGMYNTPLNEQGVVFLFAILAADLGLHAESLQSGFPDCEARRLVRTGAWQTVRIEFEYESRNFREHGHPADKCDIIVCWVHNWPECPKNLEVIELVSW